MNLKELYCQWFSQDYNIDQIQLDDASKIMTIIRCLLKTSERHDHAIRDLIPEGEYVIKDHQTWVITQNFLSIASLPTTFQVQTRIISANRFFITRQFKVVEDGNIRWNIYMQFVAIDLLTRKMARLNISSMERYIPNLNQAALPFSKEIPASEETQLFNQSLMIRDEDIDENHHVNNLTYLKWALEALSNLKQTRDIESITVKYGSELTLEHQASLQLFKESDKKMAIQIYNHTLSKVSAKIKVTYGQ